MQIVIPMSGFGERFRRAGYALPKPLIQIDGKPIIAHVIDMFPGETDFIFICNQDHLDNPDFGMAEILRRYCPSGRIIGIAPHKLGPIHAVRQVEHLIDRTQPVIVNYCDFTCYWDWNHFKYFVRQTRCDGAIPAYRGFHPHTLGSTNYAYMRETGGWLRDIKEKEPFTNNRIDEYASSGTYYFASGQLMLDAFKATIDQQLQVSGEYFVSLAYKPMLAWRLSVAVYELQHFMQWGTPEDVIEYNGWSVTFRQMIEAQCAAQPHGAVVMPMAGLGQRFVEGGYRITKPLIPVSGKPMVVQAAEDLPPAPRHAFVLRSDMLDFNEITGQLQQLYPQAVIETIPKVTEGQACTALIGLDALEREHGPCMGPVTFGACDYGAIYNGASLNRLLDDENVDLIVWAVRGAPNAVRNPQMFGWIDAENGLIRSISVKKPLSSPATDPIVLGTFTFRRSKDFRRAVRHLIDRDGRVNGEFYLDSCVNDALALGLRCHLFEVDSYLGWGTPNDLKTFEYWQSCFHKWTSHPYRLEQDHMVPRNAIEALAERYRPTIPVLPAPQS